MEDRPIEYRPLGENDAEAFWHIRLEALESEPQAFGESAEEHLATTPESVAARLASGTAAGNFVLGAFSDGRLVGTAGFVRRANIKARHKGFIWGVYVKAKWRSKGIGKALIARILARVPSEPGLEQVTLVVGTEQTAARGLYASFGFKVYGCEPRAMKVGGVFLDEDLMFLDLDGPSDGSR